MNMNRPTISLTVICKNEEHNIPAWFFSIKDCFDEIIFVDTGSTDNSVELAKALGCKVFHFDWVNDFSAARNFALDQATCDYVCWVDLDDSLSDREAFIKFRNTVMGCADFWMSNYHYAYDFEKKLPLCTFPRERIIKRNRPFRWKYFVHEGLMPVGFTPQLQFAPTWTILHRRTANDLAKDRSRNLNLFNVNQDKLDTRMMFYWGKELFENKMIEESIPKLAEAFSKPDLDAHDRVMCLQYLTYAHLETNKLQQAMELAQQGVILDPNRAEFHVVMADARIKAGDLLNALPFLYAAKHCIKNTNATSQFTFSNNDAYGSYPSNAIVKILAQMGRLDDALKEALDAKEKYQHPETDLLIKELDRIKRLQTFDYANASDCSDIIFTCFANAYEWDGEIYRRQGLGGSETAEIELAEWFAKLTTRKIIIFNSVSTEKHINGVIYKPIEMLNEYVKHHKPWMHIAWRHNTKVTNATTIVHSHDLQTPQIENLDNFDKVAVLTPWHREFMHATQNVPLDKMFLTGNGIVPQRFNHSVTKDPYSFIFSSSPDRGLDRAILVLDKVREIYPSVTLKVFYGIEHLERYGLKDLKDKLFKMMNERKDWITYYGKTEQKEMMKHFATASYVVQPSNFLETFGISALEMVCSGVYPIFRDIGGIADTLRPFVEKGMASLIDSDCVTEDEFKLYIDETIAAIKENRASRVVVDPSQYSWQNKAIEWLDEFKRLKGE